MRYKFWFVFSSSISLLLPAKAFAFCPVCTVAAASAVGLSRWLGIDDTISGMWLGALTVSAIGWTISWLGKKGYSKWWIRLLTGLIYYALILIPFYKTDIISFHPANMLWGVDKLLLGIAIGSLFFLLGHSLYLFIKEKNGGHAQFPFQKVVMPVAPVLMLNIIFYFITR